MATIKRNFFYSSILTTANYIFPLITYPYVARVLGVSNIGVVNFVDSVSNYFVLFSMMGMSILGIREVAACKEDKKQLSQTFSNLLSINLISTFIAIAVLLLCTIFIDKLRENWDLMIFAGSKVLFNCLLISWLFQGLEDFRFITLRSIAVRCLYVVSVFVFVHKSADYPIYYLLTVGAVGVNALVNDIYALKKVRYTLKSLNLQPYLRPFIVLGIYALLTSMYTTFNVAYLGFVSTDTEVGYYTTAIKLFSILLAIYTAFTGVMLPRMSALIADGNYDEFKRLLNKSVECLLGFSLPLMVFCVVFADTIVLLVAGPGYEGAVLPMRIVMALIFLTGYDQVLVIQALMPSKQDKIITRNAFYGALVGIVLNIILVPHLKSVGSSIVIVVSEAVILITSQVAVKRLIGIIFPIKQTFFHLLVFLPLALVLWFVVAQIGTGIILMACSALITIAYTIVVNLLFIRNGLIGQMALRFIRK